MAQPTYGTSGDPLADVYGQQWSFEPLTSDPSGSEQGDMWLRVDLDSGDRLATLRFDHGSGIWDVPVFPVGDSGPGVEEVLRVQTPDGLGFVPVDDSSPAFPQVGFQHDGTRYGLHDTVYGDTVIHHWPMDEGSGSTVADDVGGADGTINGPTWVSGLGFVGLDADGTDDYVETTTWGDFGSSMTEDFALATTIINHTGGQGHIVGVGIGSASNPTQLRWEVSTANSGDIRLQISDQDGNAYRIRTDGGHVDDGNIHRAVVNKVANSGSDAVEFYLDGNELTNTTVDADDGFSDPPDFPDAVELFARNADGTVQDFLGATLADLIVFGDSLSSQQIQADYDRQPWS